MVRGLRVLLENAIDYAGLFPPANMSVPHAYAEFRDHLGGDEAFLVNRFVCPVARLEELGTLIGPEDEFGITAIGTPAHDLESLKLSASADARAIEAFETRFDDLVAIDAFETRLPTGVDVGAALRALQPIADRECFLELELGPLLSDQLHALAESELACAKARTGGTTPGSHPPAAVLASFLRECLDLNLPFKLTAGLHHPFPTQDPATGDRMHGFLNVLVAAALIEEQDLNRLEIARVLDESDPSAFVFTGTQVSWREFAASVTASEGMRSLCSGFGSCSIKEPMTDLKAHGLWA